MGDLWENYLASERIKKQNYLKIKTNNYFWRTYDQQELDWLEEKGKELTGFEFKWNGIKKVKIPTAFAKAYPEATFEIISRNNYLDFITYKNTTKTCRIAIIKNLLKKDFFEILCRNKSIAKPEPIVPPKNTKARSVFSEILFLFVIANCLSYPINRKAKKLRIKKEYNKIIICERLIFKDIILAS